MKGRYYCEMESPIYRQIIAEKLKLEKKQNKLTKPQLKQKSQFHHNLINENLPFSIDNEINQNKLYIFLLKKTHIKKIQSNY